MKQELEKLLVVGARIVLGEQFCERFPQYEAGEVLELETGQFEGEDGFIDKYLECPSVYNWDNKEHDSIYHLFGNNLEDFLDCEVLPPLPPEPVRDTPDDDLFF